VNKISALIPYRPDHGRRDQIWSLVRRRYEQLMPQVELCLGSDDHELFCRAKAINAAARRATGDILMLVDIDLVFETELPCKTAPKDKVAPPSVCYLKMIIPAKIAEFDVSGKW
jgi:hypothetical protein